jgi:acetyl-CoA carboxylase biotin carboxyl carrier protein
MTEHRSDGGDLEPVDVHRDPSASGPPSERQRADHASIARLTDRLLPALVAKVAATGLGEIEIREGDWRLRVRRPGGGGAAARRERPRGGHPGHAHGPHQGEHARPSRESRTDGGQDGAAHPGGGEERQDQVLVLSPGVGFVRPGSTPGTRVRAGDRIGVVDVLGIPQEILAPADGLLVEVLVEPGEAVEYGEPIAAIEPAGGTGS